MSNSAVFLLFLFSFNSFSTLNTGQHNGYYNQHQKSKAFKIIVLLNPTLNYELIWNSNISIYCSTYSHFQQLKYYITGLGQSQLFTLAWSLLILVEDYWQYKQALKSTVCLAFRFIASCILRPTSQSVFSTHGSKFQAAILRRMQHQFLIKVSILLWPLKSPKGCKLELWSTSSVTSSCWCQLWESLMEVWQNLLNFFSLVTQSQEQFHTSGDIANILTQLLWLS